MRAERDAFFARACNLTRDDLRYILDPADVMGAAYPSETFRVLKAKETRAYGEDRTRLLIIWNHTCPLTGITDASLLRASHIIPWFACDSDAERLNPDNSLRLSALWDAAFERGLVCFTDAGPPIFHATLSATARAQLTHTAPLPLTPAQHSGIARHRSEIFAAPN